VAALHRHQGLRDLDDGHQRLRLRQKLRDDDGTFGNSWRPFPPRPYPENDAFKRSYGTTSQNLSIDHALRGLEEFLRDKIVPAIDDPFVAPMARLSGMLLRICANGVDEAAELRVEENAAIRMILGEAASLVAAPLASRLCDAAASTDPGLKISVLDAENQRLRVLLVLAQTVLETSKDGAAQSLDQRVWQLLETAEAKRAPREV
jgi:hypothetical protein